MVKRSRIVAFFLIVILFGTIIGSTTTNVLGNIKLGLDLQGGFEVLYEVKTLDGSEVTDSVMKSTTEALNSRINVLGVSEPRIDVEGDNRIRVQLAGVHDQNEAREMLSTQARLTFRDVNDNIMLDGSDLEQGGAMQSFDEHGKPNVAITLKDADKFRQVTEQILSMAPNNYLVIWLDFEEGVDSFAAEVGKENPKFLSAPTVNEVFNTKNVTITGNFTPKEAQTLANLLNAGSLPVELEEIYSTSVGAQFGEKALQKTVTAGIIGILAVFAFMLIFYRFPGFIAVISLMVYIFLTLLIFDWMNAVLTLPGIAALILGVAMAVDANIITFERIKEELKVGRSVKAAFKTGNANSLSTIFDANLTTLLAAGVLFVYGTSSVKGFALTLIISILVSFLTAVYGTRLFLGLWVNSNIFNNKPGMFGVKKSEIHDISEGVDTIDLKTPFDKWDFVKHRKKFFAIAGIIAVAGLISLLVFKLNPSIDFTSGTRIEIQTDREITANEFQVQLEKHDIVTDDIVISGDNKDIGVARLVGVLTQEEIAALKADFIDVFGAEPNVSTVSPTVGKELAKNAFISVLIAAVGIILYVTVRFEMKMAIPSVIGLLNAAFFIIAFFSFTRLEVDLTFIAAVLTVVGYAINDTIVTFDRVRENLKKRKRIKKNEELQDIVNTSIRQTLPRTVNTSITTLFAVAAVLFFGSEAITNFSLALFVGLIAGIYGSICLAVPMWYSWKSKELKEKGVLITYKEKKKNRDEAQV